MDDASPSPLAQLLDFGRKIFSSRSPQHKSCESKSRPHGEIAEDPGGKRARRRVDFDSTDGDNEQTKIQPGAHVQYKGTETVPWQFGMVVDPKGSPPRASGPYCTRAVDPSFYRTLVAAGEVMVCYRVDLFRRNNKYNFTKPVFTNCKISDLELVVCDTESDTEENDFESDEPECKSDTCTDGEKFRHESEADGENTEDESDKEATDDEVGDDLEDIQMVMEAEYVLGRASTNKEFPKLARADSAGIEKFVRKAISTGVQYKVKWKGEQTLAVADAHQSFALQIANFELGYKFRDAQIVKSENDRARYRAVGADVTVGGTGHGAVGGTRCAGTSKRKR
jgi:hypothetical protein